MKFVFAMLKLICLCASSECVLRPHSSDLVGQQPTIDTGSRECASHAENRIDSLGRHAHKRKAYFREYSIDELVPRFPAGKKMRAIIDLDHGDRVARDCGTDHEIDASDP